MKLTYGITVCTESVELQLLIDHLFKYKRAEDEVVILHDIGQHDIPGDDRKEVAEYCIGLGEKVVYRQSYLDNNFAKFKNELFELSSGDYIFQIDADEYPHEELIKLLPELIEKNSTYDLITVPRINIVNGITQEYIEKWHWRRDQNGWINFPDPQDRIYKNDYPRMRWENRVHEKITSCGERPNSTMLPPEPNFCLVHIKDLDRQVKQNEYYDTL